MLNSILWSVVGGVLIGLAAWWILLAKGRLAGISGIAGGLIGQWNDQSSWRVSFLIGLLVGGGVLAFTVPQTIVAPANRSLI